MQGTPFKPPKIYIHCIADPGKIKRNFIVLFVTILLIDFSLNATLNTFLLTVD